MKILATCLLIVLTTGCAIHPQPVYDPDDERCDLSTRKTTLSAKVISLKCGGSAACVAGIAIVGGLSVVVSGSIVVVGNTVHWLEKQGKCDDSFLNEHILRHKQPLIEEDGLPVDEKEIPSKKLNDSVRIDLEDVDQST